MTKSKYIFTDTQFGAELERLKILEKISDPASRRRILATGFNSGWKCLEVGAGAGSIMKWMSKVTGKSGKVIAVDVDTRFLQDTSLSNVEMIKGDINEVNLDRSSLDLIHIRNVLIHIVDPQAALAKILRLLKPNGWLVLEEPDFSAAKFITGTLAEQQSVTKINQAICQMFTHQEKDFALGIKLPGVLQKFGLGLLQVENDVPISRGSSDIAAMMRLSALQLADNYLNTGIVTKDDIQTYCQFAANPTSWGIYLGTVGVTGQKQAKK